MAQYTESTSEVVNTVRDSGLSSDTSAAIEALLIDSSTEGGSTIQDYDGTTPDDGTDILTVGSGQSLSEDPGTPIIIMGEDASATVTLDTSTSDRVVVGGSSDDTITTTGDGNVTVETGGGNDSIATGAGEDQIIITGSGNSSVATGDGGDTITITGDGAPTIDAGDGNDVIVVGSDQGSATVDGGAGFDGANLDDSRSEHAITIEGGVVTLNSAPIQLDNVEVVQYNDGISILGDGHVESAAGRMYEVLFDREADLGGLEHWFGKADEGNSLEDIASGFLGSQEYSNWHDAQETNTNSDFLDHLYQSGLGREADAEGKEHWLNKMSEGMTHAEVLSSFASGEEAVQLMGIDGTQYVIDIDSGQ